MEKCELCGEPMPAGEEMFKYHGYSGPCPKQPLARIDLRARIEQLPRIILGRSMDDGTGPDDVYVRLDDVLALLGAAQEQP